MAAFSHQKKIKTILGVSLVFFSVALVMWLGIFVPVSIHSQKSVTFVVEKREGSRDISYHLEKQGLIRSAPLFRIFVLTSGLSTKLQAGAYNLGPVLSAFQIAQKLATGDIIREFITVPEGWSILDIAQFLGNEGRFSPDEFLGATKKDFSGQYAFLKDKPRSASAEGYLFPDTYQITRDESADDLVRRMLSNFDSHVTQDLRNETAAQKKTIFQVVTMASIIEKEVQTLADKKIVSGILWKRLGLGMPLQVDAAPETYKVRGLPAGPIANPGQESILAALYPTQSPYWFYLSTKDGKTVYSKTLQEHNAAKAKYLK